jgi:hypothetical protein
MDELIGKILEATTQGPEGLVQLKGMVRLLPLPCTYN